MHIDASVFWHLKDLCRKDLTECDHDDHIRLILSQMRNTFRLPHTLWLINFDAILKCLFFHRRKLYGVSPALWLIRLCNRKYHFMSGFYNSL